MPDKENEVVDQSAEVARLTGEVAEWKAKAEAATAEMETHRAAAKDATDKLTATTTAHEQALAEVAQLRTDLAAKEQEALRASVAAEHRLGPDDMVLLTGTDRDTLTAQAKRVAALSQVDAHARQTANQTVQTDTELLAAELRRALGK